MRLGSAPLRFVVGVLGLWIGGRAVILTRAAPVAEPTTPHRTAAGTRAERLPSFVRSMRTAAAAPEEGRWWSAAARPGSPLLFAALRHPPAYVQPGREEVRHEETAVEALRDWRLLPAASAPDAARPARRLPLPGPVSTADAKRWSGTAYMFFRQQGDALALASGGQLGGSQLFARIAYQLPGAVSVAARVYSPLETLDGAEAAIGADLHLLRGKTPLRLSVERRTALGDQARDAWSAYAAGGFYAAVPLGLEADGYAQAGVVGLKRRDLFADAALRLSRPVELGNDIRAGVGVGAWGAAQPGVERLDIGPRASLSLPVADRSVVVNLDMRLRVAGDARPGSGVALTIGSDF